MGVTAESSVTPTVIVALSAHHALSLAVIDSDSKQSLQEEGESRGVDNCKGMVVHVWRAKRAEKFLGLINYS